MEIDEVWRGDGRGMEWRWKRNGVEMEEGKKLNWKRDRVDM